MFYGKAGLGLTRLTYSGTYNGNNAELDGVAIDETLLGYNFGFGGGAKYHFSKSIAFKLELSYRMATYMTIDGTNGSGSTDDGQAQHHIDILLLAGYKF